MQNMRVIGQKIYFMLLSEDEAQIASADNPSAYAGTSVGMPLFDRRHPSISTWNILEFSNRATILRRLPSI